MTAPPIILTMPTIPQMMVSKILLDTWDMEY